MAAVRSNSENFSPFPGRDPLPFRGRKPTPTQYSDDGFIFDGVSPLRKTQPTVEAPQTPVEPATQLSSTNLVSFHDKSVDGRQVTPDIDDPEIIGNEDGEDTPPQSDSLFAPHLTPSAKRKRGVALAASTLGPAAAVVLRSVLSASGAGLPADSTTLHHLSPVTYSSERIPFIDAGHTGVQEVTLDTQSGNIVLEVHDTDFNMTDLSGRYYSADMTTQNGQEVDLPAIDGYWQVPVTLDSSGNIVPLAIDPQGGLIEQDGKVPTILGIAYLSTPQEGDKVMTMGGIYILDTSNTHEYNTKSFTTHGVLLLTPDSPLLKALQKPNPNSSDTTIYTPLPVNISLSSLAQAKDNSGKTTAPHINIVTGDDGITFSANFATTISSGNQEFPYGTNLVLSSNKVTLRNGDPLARGRFLTIQIAGGSSSLGLLTYSDTHGYQFPIGILSGTTPTIPLT